MRLFVKSPANGSVKGSHKEQVQIIKDNCRQCSEKRITDIVQKCMPSLSIDSNAHKGLLKNVYQQEKQRTTNNSNSLSKLFCVGFRKCMQDVYLYVRLGRICLAS